MPENWEVIYTTNQLYETEIVKEMLADNAIEGVVMNKKDSAYGFGEFEIYVPTDQVFKATQLIREYKGE